MSGAEIKSYILSEGIRLWQVADKLGITDGNFSRRLRKTFNDNEINKIKAIVNELKNEKTV